MTFFSRQLNLLGLRSLTVVTVGSLFSLIRANTSAYQKSSLLPFKMGSISHRFVLVTIEPCTGSGRYSKGVYKSPIHSEIRAYTSIRCKPIKTKGIRGSFFEFEGLSSSYARLFTHLFLMKLQNMPAFGDRNDTFCHFEVTTGLLPGLFKFVPLGPSWRRLFPTFKTRTTQSSNPSPNIRSNVLPEVPNAPRGPRSSSLRVPDAGDGPGRPSRRLTAKQESTCASRRRPRREAITGFGQSRRTP